MGPGPPELCGRAAQLLSLCAAQRPVEAISPARHRPCPSPRTPRPPSPPQLFLDPRGGYPSSRPRGPSWPCGWAKGMLGVRTGPSAGEVTLGASGRVVRSCQTGNLPGGWEGGTNPSTRPLGPLPHTQGLLGLSQALSHTFKALAPQKSDLDMTTY